jgi:hypothetical protein
LAVARAGYAWGVHDPQDAVPDLRRSGEGRGEADRAAGQLPEQVDADRGGGVLDRFGLEVGDPLGVLGWGGAIGLTGGLGRIAGG